MITGLQMKNTIINFWYNITQDNYSGGYKSTNPLNNFKEKKIMSISTDLTPTFRFLFELFLQSKYFNCIIHTIKQKNSNKFWEILN